MKDRSTLLVVDDEPYNLEIISEFLGDDGHELVTAKDGVEAWALLQENPGRFDSIILDRMMPRMNGIELLGRIKADPELKTVPVILQTAAASREQVLEGLRLGAYYYLTKPFEPEMLSTVVKTALKDRQNYLSLIDEATERRGALAMLKRGEFRLRTVPEARMLAVVLADACPNPSTVSLGFAELLINAVEHGNLGITYADKSRLLAAGQWESEVTRRLGLPENEGKSVHVTLERGDEVITVRIVDQGAGFDWTNYLEMDPARIFDTHGRGIAMARKLSFLNLEYLGSGSEVFATVDLATN